MTIQVRVQLAQAQRQIAQLQAQVRGLQMQARSSGAATSMIGSGTSLANIKKFGNQVQWAGRQLQYNFSLPIIAAGSFATKWALQNEAAMVRVSKVYGDGTQTAAQMTNELNALGKAFVALSDKFGVAQADVINIAADWAAAGSSGLALAKATQLTIQTMILGEMSAAEATSALISIQAQYGQSTDQLSKTIDTLNIVENQTGTTMEDLIQSMTRSAGAARTAGVDVQHLAALTAALTPAAGSASTSGTMLKTVFSRLANPTRQVADGLTTVGANLASVAWQSENGVQKLADIAKGFKNLSDAQKQQVASQIAGTRQVSRFEILLQALNNPLSYYYKALNSSADANANYAQKVKELNQVLDSNPQKLKIIGTTLQNSLTQVIQPLLPILLMLANTLAALARGFANLSPQTQKWVAVGLLLLAVIGPILRYVGSLLTLVGYLIEPFKLAVTVMREFAGMALLVGSGVSKLVGLFLMLGKGLISGLAPMVKLVQIAVTPIIGVFATLGEGIVSMLGSYLTMAAVLILEFVDKAAAEFAYFVYEVLGQTFVSAIKDAMLMLSLYVSAGITSLGKILGPGMAAVSGIFSTAWTAIQLAALAFWDVMETVYLAGMYAIEAIVSAGGLIFGNLWTFINLAMVKISQVTMTTLRRVYAVGIASLKAIMAAAQLIASGPWTFFNLALVKISQVTTGLLRKLWAAYWVALEAITVAGGMALKAVQTVVLGGITLVWEAVTGAIELLWTKMWVALAAITEEGGLLTAVKSAMGSVIGLLSELGPAIMAALVSPWTWAIAAIAVAIGLIVHNAQSGMGGLAAWLSNIWSNVRAAFAPMVNFFGKAVNDIVKAFDALPQGVQGALLAVVRTVAAAAMAVYHWFSYLNPFAHHSPSLVEVVTLGAAEIKKQYGGLKAVGVPFRQAAKDLAAFKNATKGKIGDGFGGAAKDIAKYFPSVLPLFNKLRTDLKGLNVDLGNMQIKVDAQQRVVDAWSAKLDKANAALTKQQNILTKAQNKLDKLQNQYDAAQSAMQQYAQTPIQGMQQYTDAIFANQEAQKKLQLQIDQYEQSNGSIDDMKNKMQSLAGDIEKLKGEASDLKMGGAGSDVLGPINQQIDAMQAQYNAIDKAAQNSPENAMQSQLAQLQKQGEILQLQSDIKFDPLTKQIDDLANAQKALPFDQIIAGITAEQAKMAALQPQIDAQTTAVNNQKKAVDLATQARDKIQKTYDSENKKLQTLQDQYNNINGAINEITDSLNAMGGAASKAAQKASAAASGGLTASPAGNFPAVGGNAKIGREGPGLDQSKGITDFTQSIQDSLGNFGDMFGPIKKYWNVTWGWIKKNVGPVMTDLDHAISAGFSGTGKLLGQALKSSAGKTFIKDFEDLFSGVANVVATIMQGIIIAVGVVWPELKKAGQVIWNTLTKIFQKVIPTISKFITQIKPLLAIIGVALVLAWKVLAAIIINVAVPVLNAVIGVFDSVLNIIGGIIDFVYNVFTGQWAKAWDDVKQIFLGVWNLIYSIFSGIIGTIYGVVKGIVEGIVNFFTWLYDVLVGHSIIPDLVHAIVDLFNWMLAPLKAAWNAVWTAVKAVWDTVVVPMFDLMKAYIKAWAIVFSFIYNHIIKPAWDAIWTGIKTVWNSTAKPIWEGMKAYVKAWAEIFKWIWNNVIKPAWDVIWTGIKAVWNNTAKPLWDGIKTVVKGLGQTFNDVKTTIKKAWDLIWSGLKTAWDKVGSKVFNGVASAIVGAVNIAIDAINAIAKGFNAITGLLHINFKIGTIDELAVPKFATGGALPWQGVGAGFKTNGPRAIVGEGNSAYPEYVIPTDPRYRNNAKSLWQAAGQDIHMYGIGGVIGSVGGAIGGAVGAVGGAIKGAVKFVTGAALRAAVHAAFWPVKTAADALFDTINIPFISDMGHAVLNKVWDWISNLAKSQGDKIDADNASKKAKEAHHAMGGVLPAFASGGIANRPTVGVFGEAGREVLAPLTPLWRRLDRIENAQSEKVQNVTNNTTIHFHGDLSFPNIKSGDDAEDFLKNLEVLAGK